jgi:5-methylcytosine-specific restriction protein A
MEDCSVAISDITAVEVKLALAEYDELTEPTFLAKYGFKPARTYMLQHEGRLYASKAILGAAHGYLPGQKPLTSDMFYGGKAAAAADLRRLGFDVTGPGRNPSWNRDELILALDLYFKNPASPPGKTSAEVVGLSNLLNKMRRLSGRDGDETYRNANGVYLKLMNLRSLDPAYTAQGKVGMQSGGTLERVLWEEFLGRREALRAEALVIRSAVEAADDVALDELPSAEPYEGEEGGVVLRLHKRYERDPRLVAEKKKSAKAAGDLSCEVCGFDFAQRYGQLGADFIEVHHTRPVHQMRAGAKTKLTDLALLCSNCHRMAHRRREPLSLDQLRASLAAY